jgi:hypothetical protein
MKMGTLVDIWRLAGRTARIGTIRSKAVRRRMTEVCGEEPCRRLGNPQMFKHTHPQLFNIAGSKDACGNNTLRVLSGATLDKDHRSILFDHNHDLGSAGEDFAKVLSHNYSSGVHQITLLLLVLPSKQNLRP